MIYMKGKERKKKGEINMKKIEMAKEVFETLETWTTYNHNIMVDGVKAGYATTMQDSENEDEVYLEDIVIKEEFRNQGIGTQVIEALAEEYGYIYFAPTDENNQRLYERIAEEIVSDAPEVDQGYGVYYLES